MTPCRASKHWRTLSESFSHFSGKNIWFTQPTLFFTPITCCQSGPSSEGALNYKIKVWLSPPPCIECWLWGFYCPVITWQYHQFSSRHAWTLPLRSLSSFHSPRQCMANRTGRVFALLPKRIWVKTRFSRAKHQTSVRRCANREVVGAAEGHANI